MDKADIKKEMEKLYQDYLKKLEAVKFEHLKKFQELLDDIELRKIREK